MQGQCPNCKTVIQIPKTPHKQKTAATGPSGPNLQFNCPQCKKQVNTSASLAGKKGKCPHCLDGGVENFHGAVDELVDSGLLKHLLAKTEITFSNSLIESWWRVLKHQWLYLNSLDTVSTLTKLVRFYVQEHNTRLPHSAFRGQTPDEMYFKTGKEIPRQLEAARDAARAARMDINRKNSCAICEPLTSVAS